jgi:hypothetical protein
VLLFALCAVMGLCVTRIHFYYFSVIAANVSYLGQLAAVIVLHTRYPALQPKDTHRSLATLALAVIGAIVCLMTITGVCLLSGNTQIPLLVSLSVAALSVGYYYAYGRHHQKLTPTEIKLLLQFEMAASGGRGNGTFSVASIGGSLRATPTKLSPISLLVATDLAYTRCSPPYRLYHVTSYSSSS